MEADQWGLDPGNHGKATPSVIYNAPFQGGTNVVVSQCYMLLCPCVYSFMQFDHLGKSCPLCFLFSSEKENECYCCFHLGKLNDH